MRIDILSLFPEMFDGFISSSIIKRAIENNKVIINIINFREFSKLNNNQVDDEPFGGGSGMVLMLDPIVSAINSIKTSDSYIILLDPKARVYNQQKAKELKAKKHIILICGHYEGIDERIKNYVDEVISIGDFILTGGEIPAMLITDSIVRLLDGVITSSSLDDESFNDFLLDYPVYTKPRNYDGLDVPEVLLSGNHKKINEYRKNEQIRLTKEYRPDLMEKYHE